MRDKGAQRARRGSNAVKRDSRDHTERLTEEIRLFRLMPRANAQALRYNPA